MPLFMDFHKNLSVSIEDVKKAHIADERIQGKYGVIYHQFWVNEIDGTVFCLMEGPDKESCAAVHREAHGNVACSIVEVSAGFYKLFMGNGHTIDQGHVKYADGSPDLAIRHILAINIQGLTSLTNAGEYRSLKPPYQAKDLALSLLSKYAGREVNRLHDDSLIAVFDDSWNALNCGLEIQKVLLGRKSIVENHEWNIAFRMGLCAGQPLTQTGAFFSDTITMARRLCSIANDNELLISQELQKYCSEKAFAGGPGQVRVINPREQQFITSLFAISEEKLADEHFTVESLSRNIGMSRPKLYRTMVSLTGKSPNDFIRDLRMDKAVQLLKQKAGNISEIALEVGYNNPSYFAKCFQTRYGCTPSRFDA
ncbi:MAG: nickel-binding protein [Chryseosolibacter sp.]